MTDQSNLGGGTSTERVAIVGSGAIASGLAATASGTGRVLLIARSESSAERARASIQRSCERLETARTDNIEIVEDLEAAGGATFIVEAIVEDHAAKAGLLERLAKIADEETMLATTTSSLSIEALAAASGRPESFVGLHVFNPVIRMELVELVFPRSASESTYARARALCRALGKTAVEVPDTPGFVVNRLLFPYLFDAVRLMEETGLEAEQIDTAMRLGASHPIGPLALLDLVGLDVSKAIGETLGEAIPAELERLIDVGALGRKTGRGFHEY